jgi:predicted GNAT superfamily acetyltransferase
MIAPLQADSFDAVLALNEANVQETSPLDVTALQALVGQSFLALAVDDGQSAFLIALDQTATYDSPNFQWFGERMARFVYVDRIVVAANARGRGLARQLYTALFEAAERAGHDRVVCEVNLEPPNPASDAFHAALGFERIGTAAIHGGSKTVQYLQRRV